MAIDKQAARSLRDLIMQLEIHPPVVGHLRVIPSMSLESIAQVQALEEAVSKLPQAAPTIEHMFHAGMYARTVRLERDMVITGALVKLATVLIVSGNVIVYVDGEAYELDGYHVFAAQSNRKQAFVAKESTWITMIFPTSARSVVDAEMEFTDETNKLSPFVEHNVIVTGE